MMEQSRAVCLRERVLFLVPVTELWIAREKARLGDRDAAIPVTRKAVEELDEAGGLSYGLWATHIHVETLLERGAESEPEASTFPHSTFPHCLRRRGAQRLPRFISSLT